MRRFGFDMNSKLQERVAVLCSLLYEVGRSIDSMSSLIVFSSYHKLVVHIIERQVMVCTLNIDIL